MPDPAVRASIVIPVFDEVFLTRVCLLSLEKAELDGAEIIVVDNGSTDSTPALLAEWSAGGPGRIAVRSDVNLGFARGCNLGAEHATGGVLVFLNNDTFVLREWLSELLRPFSDPSVWVTGSRLLYPNGRVQHAGVVFMEGGPAHVFGGLRGDLPLVLEQREYQAVTAASMAIRREVFERLGGFDTSYFNSYEDGDLCLKVREAGGRIMYVPTSVAYHWECMSKGRLSANDVRNRELFLERWRGRFEVDQDRVMKAAEAAGYDLSDRLPGRAEQHNRQVALEEAAAERDRVVWELAQVRSELEQVRSERDQLKLALQARSVRAARWLAHNGRRLLPDSPKASTGGRP